MAKRFAGPTTDGTYIYRTTQNDYGFAVAVLDESPTRYLGHGEYGPNPSLGQWVSYSWHRTHPLAARSLDQARSHGHRAIIVPVIEGKPPVETPTTPEEEPTMPNVNPDPKVKKTPEQKKVDRAAYMKARRAAAKANTPETVAAAIAEGDAIRDAKAAEVETPIAPVVELPTSDAPRVAGSTLAEEFVSTLRERLSVDIAEKAAKNSPYSTLSADGKPIGYVNVNKTGIRVEARQADGTKVSYKATSSDDFAAALDALAEVVEALFAAPVA